MVFFCFFSTLSTNSDKRGFDYKIKILDQNVNEVVLDTTKEIVLGLENYEVKTISQENVDSSNKIIEAVNRLKESITMMNKENQNKTMKYFSNLKKLCCLYHELI